MVRDCWQEYERRCGFVRVFPSHDSWDLYSSLLESKGRLNFILHQELYPGKIKGPSHSPTPLSTVIAKRASISTTTQTPCACDPPEGLLPLERVAVYLRKLENGPKLKPLWDSVCELLWRRDSPATTVSGLGTRTEAGALLQTDISSPTPEPVQSLLTNIRKLSKVQARRLFAVYLERVRARLSKETSTLYLKSQEAQDKANLDVIIHFLKCAAKSLCSPFTLIEPGTELPMRHRKGMLARQLAEFITLYTKETEDLAANPNQALGLPGKVLDAALSIASEKELERLLAAYAEHSHSSAVLFGPSARSSWEKPKPRVPKSGKHVLSRHSHLSRVLQRQSRVSRSGSPHPSGSHHDSSSHTTSTACKTLGVGCGDALEALTGSLPPYDFKKYSDRPVETSYWTSGHTHSMQDSSGYAGDGVREEVSREGLLPRSPERWVREAEGGFKEEDKGARKKIGREGLVCQQSPERWARGEGGAREEGSGRRARGRRLLRRTLSNQSLHSLTSNTSVQTKQSVLQSFRTNSIGLIRPQSATLISNTKTSVSPYAQPGVYWIPEL
ncbi:Tubulin polyglutamylase TTLL5, partial [Geodia barretti]